MRVCVCVSAYLCVSVPPCACACKRAWPNTLLTICAVQLQHPHIIKVHGYVQDQNTLTLVMELVRSMWDTSQALE